MRNELWHTLNRHVSFTTPKSISVYLSKELKLALWRWYVGWMRVIIWLLGLCCVKVKDAIASGTPSGKMKSLCSLVCTPHLLKRNNCSTVKHTAMPTEQAELPNQWLNDKMWQFLASVNIVVIFELDLASVSLPSHQVTSENTVALLWMFSNKENRKTKLWFEKKPANRCS